MKLLLAKLFNTIPELTALLKPRPSGQCYDSLANKPVRVITDAADKTIKMFFGPKGSM